MFIEILLILEAIVCLVIYFIFVRTVGESNKEFPDQKQDNPYLGIHLIFILMFIFTIGFFSFYTYLKSTEITKLICINEIEEYQKTIGFLSYNTEFHAYINNEYDILFDRPNQYKEGDCFNIKRDKIFGWGLDEK